jgi:Mn-dependent DtxR family transcriptional regulator
VVLHESAEDYLETILILFERNGQVRSIDIVNEMNFSKPSISIAMKKLRENGYIRMDVNGLITLTDEGRLIAERIYSRHKLLTKVLEAIGIDEKKAEDEACKIEHDIDDETYDRIRDFYLRYTEKMKQEE